MSSAGSALGIQSRQSVDAAQASVDHPQRIVFMGQGVTKIDQQGIAEILGDMAGVALDQAAAVS